MTYGSKKLFTDMVEISAVVAKLKAEKDVLERDNKMLIEQFDEIMVKK